MLCVLQPALRPAMQPVLLHALRCTVLLAVLGCAMQRCAALLPELRYAVQQCDITCAAALRCTMR